MILLFKTPPYFSYFDPLVGVRVLRSTCMLDYLSLTYLKTTFPNFTKFSVHVACGRGSDTAMNYIAYVRFRRLRHVLHNRPGKGDANTAYS